MSAPIVRHKGPDHISDVSLQDRPRPRIRSGHDGSLLVARWFWVLGRGFLNTVQVEQQPDSLTDLENFRQTL
jgi:hypothetical protein